MKIALAILLGSILINNHPAYSQNDSDTAKLKQEIGALQANQTAIQKDIAEIKNLLMLQAKQAAAAMPAQPLGPTTDNPTVVKLDGGMTRGNKDAKLTLVE